MMSEKLKTIKELADELGVSKQGVRYHMKSIPQKELKKNNKGIVVLNIEQQNFIKRKAKSDTTVSGKSDTAVSGKSDTAVSGKSDTAVSGKSDTTVSGKSDTVVRYKQEISFLEEKNLLKDNQIDYLKQQIKNYENQANNLIEVQKQTQNLLDQQQRLALQDKKLLEEYKVENDSLKALKMPTEDTKEEQVEHQPQEKLEALKSEIKTLQEQLNEQATIEPQEAPRKWWKFWK
ncbi:helix-turn-helix transcriptional regulator [Lactococcus formosensis]|uniref:helix-turn-helix transcriptional regulator n=1 Tax=Lactococcus formosensis TaxID=1281486 RepID=UPI002435AE24|nr:DNA-binding protein [Lactococcus formosensis]MDG6188417.1 DNA-binding protein [Lactococcus formosensis]